jgi:hypothetical protein
VTEELELEFVPSSALPTNEQLQEVHAALEALVSRQRKTCEYWLTPDSGESN